MSRIGVFICHCGENIARTVDCAQVVEDARTIPGVAHAVDYRYMCSDPGQRLIQEAIREKGLTGVVVASCSPRMHEVTFRRTVAQADLNPFLCEMANIREQCSWVHPDRAAGTQKASDLVRLMVEKVKWNQPLTPIHVPITKRALVIGGGIAGIQAALDIANGGREVVLVEKDPSIGGHMAQLSETFPTLDCSQCILTPRMVEVKNHPNIRLYTYAEVEAVDGYIGNFEVTIRKKARSVNEALCTGCGECQTKCPQAKSRNVKILSEFDAGLSRRAAIYVPFPQAVPNVPVIDRANCRFYTDGKCRACEKTCPAKAIDLDQEDQQIKEKVGAIVVATGYDVMPTSIYGEYGGGRVPDIIDGLQFERLLSASGPTGGEVKRPSDGKVPETVVFVACAGSRDRAKGVPYCSKICCMYTAKHAMLYKHKVHQGQAYVFYMDIRAGGKNYDEFVRRAIEEDGAIYLRGRVSRIYQKNGKRAGVETLAQMLRVPYDGYHFLSEAHPKLRPVETSCAGIFLAGACQAPKDIPETVAQASGAASKVLGLFSADELEREPTVSVVNERTCVGCFDCERICPFGAVERRDIRDRKGNLLKVVSHVNEGVCAGCGACAVACRSGSIDLAGYTDQQIFAEIAAVG